jgi:hypothetical protein
MTPKDKAKELVNVYLDITKRSLDIEGWFYDIDIAKQCALIAVDELIEEACFTDEYIKSVFFTDGYYDRQDYWQEVKQEIEKL